MTDCCVVACSAAVPVDADVNDGGAAELSLEPEVTVCLAVSGVGAFVWLDCLACAAVEMVVDVGGAVVLSDLPEVPSVVVVSDFDDVISWFVV